MKKIHTNSGREGLFNNIRCRICNKVSHAEISGDYGDHSQESFYEEDDGLGFLCHECYVESTLADYPVEDEFDEDDTSYPFWYDAEDDA